MSAAYSWRDRVGRDIAENFTGSVSLIKIGMVEAVRHSWGRHEPFRREGPHEIMRSFAQARRPVSLQRRAPVIRPSHFAWLPTPHPI